MQSSICQARTCRVELIHILPRGSHAVPAQEGSRGKREAVGESANAKQEQCQRTVW